MIRIYILFTCLFISILEARALPHLILHFDVNKTLIASDQTENKSFEDVINELLSKKHKACWDQNMIEPMTFENYVKTILLPGEEHNAKLKEERLHHLIHFLDFLKEQQHPLYPVVLKEFTSIIESFNHTQTKIFPSFYALINELNQQNISFTLFLRSFGKEVFEIKNEINQTYDNLFQGEGIFQKGILHLSDQRVFRDAHSLYHFFSSGSHTAIRDDWDYWMKGKMGVKYAKIFCINQNDKEVLSLFFDDNIKIDAEINIIAPIDSNTGQFFSIPALIKSKQLIPVNTIEAILNERYYIDLVQEAIQYHLKN